MRVDCRSQVIFSQSSELLERESSMASSLEEVSGTPGNEPSGGAHPTDHFGVFKDFDFLEYESESIEVNTRLIDDKTRLFFDFKFFSMNVPPS